MILPFYMLAAAAVWISTNDKTQGFEVAQLRLCKWSNLRNMWNDRLVLSVGSADRAHITSYREIARFKVPNGITRTHTRY